VIPASPDLLHRIGDRRPAAQPVILVVDPNRLGSQGQLLPANDEISADDEADDEADDVAEGEF